MKVELKCLTPERLKATRSIVFSYVSRNRCSDPIGDGVTVTAIIGDTSYDMEVSAKDFLKTMHNMLGQMVQEKLYNEEEEWKSVFVESNELARRTSN